MPKFTRTSLLDRKVQLRDARIFVVATEGERTEKRYFHGLQEQEIIDRSRVVVHVLPSDGASAPKRVFEAVDRFVRDRDFHEDLDEIWLVLDVDRWPEKQLSEVAQAAAQKGYFLAISNPCFELWLLLHVTGETAGITTCDGCEGALRRLLGAYNKSNLDVSPYTRGAVLDAIERACRLDGGQVDRWPQALGSHVHRLAARLLGQA